MAHITMTIKWEGEGWYFFRHAYGWNKAEDENDIRYAIHHKLGVLYVKNIGDFYVEGVTEARDGS